MSPVSQRETPSSCSIDWRSLIVIYIVTVVTEAARGLLLASTWPYFKSLGGTDGMLGVLIGIYSFGRMLSVTPLGHITDQGSLSALVMIVASVIQAVGHMMYATAPNLFFLYMSRVIVGFGSASTSVARAHIAKAIPAEIRTHHYAYLSGLQFFGFAVLPAVGCLASMLPTYHPLPFVDLNEYTYPAWLLVFANLFCVALIRIIYTNPPESPPPSTTQSPQSSSEPLSPEPTVETGLVSGLHFDRYAFIVCLLVNIVFRGILAELETVSIPFLMEVYVITYASASVCLSVIGCLGVIVYFSFKPIAARFSDRFLVIVGLLAILFGCLPLSMPTLVSNMGIIVYVVLLGFTWSAAYPIGQTSILSLYSKVVEGQNAGSLMGLFSASGAISPLILSVVASGLWEAYGRESVFGYVNVLVVSSLVLVAVSYRKLQPLLPL